MGSGSIWEGRKAKCELQCLPLLITDHLLWHDEGDGEWLLLPYIKAFLSARGCSWVYPISVCAMPLQ